MSANPHVALVEAAGRAGASDIDLAAAALALAAMARPELDLAQYQVHLKSLAATAARALSRESAATAEPRELAEALAAALHGGFGYDGERAAYDDIRNADLAYVIERRRGLPVTLGILYIHTARALGAKAHGINFPGHFLTGLATERGSVLIDPFHAGRMVDGDDLEGLLPRGTVLTEDHLAALTDRGTLIRLQNNILTRARAGEDWLRAALTLEQLTRLTPESAGLRYELADAYARIERPNAARAQLEDALKREPDAPWAADARALLMRMKRSLN